MWVTQPVQTFFPGTNRKYFPVTCSKSSPTNTNVSKFDLVNNMLSTARLQDNQPQLDIDIIQKDSGKTEKSPWLTRTDWKRMFENRDMKSLIDQTSKETTGDDAMKSVG